MTALKFSSTTWSCRKTRIRYWFMAILIGWTPGGVFDFGVPRVRNLVPPNLHLLGIPPMVLQVDDFWESHLLMDRLPASWRASEDQLGTSMCFLLLIVKILFFFVVCSCFWACAVLAYWVQLTWWKWKKVLLTIFFSHDELVMGLKLGACMYMGIRIQNRCIIYIYIYVHTQGIWPEL